MVLDISAVHEVLALLEAEATIRISYLSVILDVLSTWASPLLLEVMAPLVLIHLDLLDLLLELLQDLLLLCLDFIALNVE